MHLIISVSILIHRQYDTISYNIYDSTSLYAWCGCMFHTIEITSSSSSPHLFPFQAEYPSCNSQGLSNVGSTERTWPPSAVHRSHPSCIKSWKSPGHQTSNHHQLLGSTGKSVVECLGIASICAEFMSKNSRNYAFAKAHCHLQHGCRGKWTWQPDKAQQRAYHEKVVTGCTKQWLVILLLQKEM